MQARKRLSQVARRSRDDHCAAGGRTTELGQGRGIDSYSLVAEPRVGVAGAAAADRAAGSCIGREDPTAE